MSPHSHGRTKLCKKTSFIRNHFILKLHKAPLKAIGGISRLFSAGSVQAPANESTYFNVLGPERTPLACKIVYTVDLLSKGFCS